MSANDLEDQELIEEEEEDFSDYNVTTSITTTTKTKQETTSNINSVQINDNNLDQNSNASENNEVTNEESFELIKISSDSENVLEGSKNNSNTRNIQQQQQQQQQQQASQNYQRHEFDKEEEEEDNEIQLTEVSNWRKQNQQQQEQEQQEQQQHQEPRIQIKVPTETQNVNQNTYNRDNDDEENQLSLDNIPSDGDILRAKFQQFMEQKKQKCVLYLDEGRVNLLPAPLRQPIQNIINTVKRLTARNPTGAPLSALQILAERLDEFLELQEHRSDRDYELRCRDLLSIIYRNTIEAQRLSRQLRDAAAPRSLDEYENY